MTHWTDAYRGRAWTKEYTCGHLFVDVQREHFGLEVDIVDFDPLSVLSCVRALTRESAELGNWIKVDIPREGDAVQMSHAKNPHHLGVWIEADGGGVLHSLEGAGVVFMSRRSLRMNGWNIVAFRRHRSRL